MIEVIRIFSHEERRMKSSYDSDYRNYLNNWPSDPQYSCASKVGNRLLLLKKLKSDLKFDKSIGLILISENKKQDKKEDKSSVFTYPKNYRILNLGLLKIKRTEDSLFEIHVVSSKKISSLEIASPERFGHKVAEIKPNKTIRYRTNHKYDTWGMRRGERSFEEEDFVIQHLGFVDEIDFSMDEKKEVKLTIDKLIDERKILK